MKMYLGFLHGIGRASVASPTAGRLLAIPTGLATGARAVVSPLVFTMYNGVFTAFGVASAVANVDDNNHAIQNMEFYGRKTVKHGTRLLLSPLKAPIVAVYLAASLLYTPEKTGLRLQQLKSC